MTLKSPPVKPFRYLLVTLCIKVGVVLLPQHQIYCQEQSPQQTQRAELSGSQDGLPYSWISVASTIDGQRYSSINVGDGVLDVRRYDIGGRVPFRRNDASETIKSEIFVRGSELSWFIDRSKETRKKSPILIDRSQTPWTYSSEVLGSGSVIVDGNVAVFHQSKVGALEFDSLELWQMCARYYSLSKKRDDIARERKLIDGQGLSGMWRELMDRESELMNEMVAAEWTHFLSCDVTSLAIRSRLARESGDVELAELLEKARQKKQRELESKKASEEATEDDLQMSEPALAAEAAPNEQKTGASGEHFPPGEHPFDGHWKLHSAKRPSGEDLFVTDLQPRSPDEAVLDTFFIRDRRLFFWGEEITDYKMRSVGKNYELTLEHDNSMMAETLLVVQRRQETLLLTSNEPEDSFELEFWRIHPDRDKTLEKLKQLYSVVSDLRVDGKNEEVIEVQKEIDKFSTRLERIDRVPEIESLTMRALRARGEGDHKTAKELEQQADSLANKGQQRSEIPEGMRIVSIPIGPSEKLAPFVVPGTAIDLLYYSPERWDPEEKQNVLETEVVFTEITVFGVERLKGEQRRWAVSLLATPEQAPRLQRFIQRELSREDDGFILVQAGRFNREDQVVRFGDRHKPDASPSDKNQQALSEELHLAEATSRSIATKLRHIKELSEAERKRLTQSLKQQVGAAFEARWQIQEGQLNRAWSELIELRRKHQRRKERADEIINRRVKALMEGDETSWLQTDAGQPEQNSSPQSRMEHSDAEVAQPTRQTTFDESIDPKLRGRWNLKAIVGPGILSHEQQLEVEISDSSYTLIRTYLNDQRSEIWARTDTSTNPPQILFSNDAGQSIFQRSIYSIEGNTLKIASLRTGSDDVPTDFDAQRSAVTTLERIVPLPDFETPQQLINFMVKVGGTGGGDVQFDQYIQLLTEEEQKRFAGVLLTTISMMESVSGLVMLAPQLGGEVDPEAARGLAMMPQLSQLISKHTLASPPTQAKAMFDILRSRFQPMTMMLGAASAVPLTPVDEFSRQLRLASGILKDPVAFCKETMELLQAMDADSTNHWTGTTIEDWNIVVTGNTATAQQKPKPGDKKDSPPEIIGLARIGNTWKITSMMSDRTLSALAQGPTFSDSGDEDDKPSEEPQ